MVATSMNLGVQRTLKNALKSLQNKAVTEEETEYISKEEVMNGIR